MRISEDFRGFDQDERWGALKKRELAGEDVSRERQAYLMEKAAAILRADEKELLSLRPASSLSPREARIRASVRCAQCGEKFMESRGRTLHGKIVCIPCSERG